MQRKIFLTEEQFKTIIQYHSINENELLLENLSDYIFHFTSIGNLEYIIKNNTFILSSVYYNSTDFNLGEGFPFYMSFTRQFSNKFGYSQYKNTQLQNIKNQLNVRIELDGRKLSNNYVGKPVNYHSQSVKNNKQQKDVGDDAIKMVEIRQSEDRLFSRYPFIKNVDKFINRIDILLERQIFLGRKNTELMNIILRILKDEKYKDKIFIYDNENDFNYFHNTNFINDKIKQLYSNNERMLNRFSDNDKFNDKITDSNTLGRGNGRIKQYPLTLKQCRVIACLIRLIAYLNHNDKNPEKYIIAALDGYKVGNTIKNNIMSKIFNHYKRIKDIHDPQYLEDLSDIVRHFSSNFRYETRILFGNINYLLYNCINNFEKQYNLQNLKLRDIILMLKNKKI